ncbi:MAG: hypothetical protein M1831_000309 [Alyxoria varia]|nr:MAG: hypothetical protein M1831_000309 [Alyxoria varia]
MADSKKMNQVLGSVFKHTKIEAEVDWDAVAAEIGQKYTKNARRAFKQAKQKLVDGVTAGRGGKPPVNAEGGSGKKNIKASGKTLGKRKVIDDVDAQNDAGEDQDLQPANKKGKTTKEPAESMKA